MFGFFISGVCYLFGGGLYLFPEKFTTPCNIIYGFSFGVFSLLMALETVIMLFLCYNGKNVLKMSWSLCFVFSFLIAFVNICITE